MNESVQFQVNRSRRWMWWLPADGGVDLQPPDEAFPPFLRSDIMQKRHYARSPLRGQFRSKDSQNRAQHILQKGFRRGDCVTSDLAAAFCSCFILMASSLTGLGMKVMSAPSFTSRPIHQSLLYFCIIYEIVAFRPQFSWANEHWLSLCQRPLPLLCEESLWFQSWWLHLGLGNLHLELHSNSH